MFGSSGKWGIIEKDEKQCWLGKASDISFFVLSLDKNGQHGIAFSVEDGAIGPNTVPVAINAMNVLFSKDVYQLKRNFVLIGQQPKSRSYSALLTPEEVKEIMARRFITFTELISKAQYSHASAAHNTDYNETAVTLWKQCADQLP